MENDDGATMNMTADEHKMLRVGTLWFPITMVVSLVVFGVVSAWTASAEKSRIDTRLDRMTDQIKDIGAAVEKLTTRVGQPGGDYITRQQWVIMCLQHEILNPTWRCAYGARAGWVPTAIETAGIR